MYKKEAKMRRELLLLCINFQKKQFVISRVRLNFSKKFRISLILAIVNKIFWRYFSIFFLYYKKKENLKKKFFLKIITFWIINNNFIELFDNYLVINMATICSSYDIFIWFWRDIWLYWIHWTINEKSRIFVFFQFFLWYILLRNIYMYMQYWMEKLKSWEFQ